MKQSNDPLQIKTKTQESTGARAHSKKVDDNDNFDIDIDDFDIGQPGDNQGQEFTTLDPKAMQTHQSLMRRGIVIERTLIDVAMAPESDSILPRTSSYQQQQECIQTKHRDR